MASCSKVEEPKRNRFSSEDDIILLKEVIANNPMSNPQVWIQVTNQLNTLSGKTFSLRTVKDHLQLLLKTFTKKDRENRNKSGIEEIYNEKDHLLQELSDICKECDSSIRNKRQHNVSKDQQIVSVAKQMRNNYAQNYFEEKNNEENENISENILGVANDHQYVSSQGIAANIEVNHGEIMEQTVTEEKQTSSSSSVRTELILSQGSNRKILGPLRRRNLQSVGNIRQKGLDYLNYKAERDYENRKKELELDERKVALAERRITLEEDKLRLQQQEQKEKFQLEINEREYTKQLLASQQLLIDTLLKRLQNYEEK